MKLSYNWLKDYLDCDLSAQEIADAMTSIGIEVDSVSVQETVPGGLAGVVVARVAECAGHPDSDHLHITKVDDGSGELLTVVCGAPNVAAGQKVLFARLGTVLPGDFKIKKSKIRGVESFGMICAEDELGIGHDHAGIMVLPDDAVIGTPAADYLNLETDTVIEYEITANRVDAASHIGVARDLYAYLKFSGRRACLNIPDVRGVEISGPGESIPVEVQAPDGAPRYIGVTIRGMKVGPSPEWLCKRLGAIGLHPINNIVDISNFILFETGQPLHTFDADAIGGGKVVVRRAAEGEPFVTLDGVSRKLLSTDLVIADAARPMCLAGVFGGLDSGVTDKTADVFLECAYFDPGTIRKTSKKHGISTDASFRYERGADPMAQDYVVRRAVQLLLEVAGGKVEGPARDIISAPASKAVISLDYSRMQALIGKQIGKEAIEDILGYLGYEFRERTAEGAVVAAPSYMVDVTRECDVVEEVLRIYGYNNIELPGTMRISVNPSAHPDPEELRNYVSNFLAANGFAETMNNSLTRGEYYDKLITFPRGKCAAIVNPLSADLNVMRQTLLLSGLEVISYNLNRQIPSLRTFEFGSVYSRDPEGDGTTLESYSEHPSLAIFMSGPEAKSWRVAPDKGSYFVLKGYLELIFSRFGIDIYSMFTEPAPSDIFSEGQSFSLPGIKGTLAVMGTVSPVLAKRFDIRQPVFAAEINWELMLQAIKRIKVKFSEMPKFPGVRRDLALLLDEGVTFADLRASSFKACRKVLKSVSLFDVYRGDKIPAGKKQYALGFFFQDQEKTLTDTEIEKNVSRLVETFAKEYGASLR